MSLYYHRPDIFIVVFMTLHLCVRLVLLLLLLVLVLLSSSIVNDLRIIHGPWYDTRNLYNTKGVLLRLTIYHTWGKTYTGLVLRFPWFTEFNEPVLTRRLFLYIFLKLFQLDGPKVIMLYQRSDIFIILVVDDISVLDTIRVKIVDPKIRRVDVLHPS